MALRRRTTSPCNGKAADTHDGQLWLVNSVAAPPRGASGLEDTPHGVKEQAPHNGRAASQGRRQCDLLCHAEPVSATQFRELHSHTLRWMMDNGLVEWQKGGKHKQVVNTTCCSTKFSVTGQRFKRNRDWIQYWTHHWTESVDESRLNKSEYWKQQH